MVRFAWRSSEKKWRMVKKKCGTAGLVILAFAVICFTKACMLSAEYPAASFPDGVFSLA